MTARRRCKAVQVTEFREVRCSVQGCTQHPPRKVDERTFWAAWCDDACGLVRGAESRTEARRLANEENAFHARKDTY